MRKVSERHGMEAERRRDGVETVKEVGFEESISRWSSRGSVKKGRAV